MEKIKNRMTKEKRKQFAAAAAQIVTKKKRKNGSTSVQGPRLLHCTYMIARCFDQQCLVKDWNEEAT